jgi:hypothetical protein
MDSRGLGVFRERHKVMWRDRQFRSMRRVASIGEAARVGLRCRETYFESWRCPQRQFYEGRGEAGLVVRDHYAVRLLDVLDLLASAYRIART